MKKTIYSICVLLFVTIIRGSAAGGVFEDFSNLPPGTFESNELWNVSEKASMGGCIEITDFNGNQCLKMSMIYAEGNTDNNQFVNTLQKVDGEKIIIKAKIMIPKSENGAFSLTLRDNNLDSTSGQIYLFTVSNKSIKYLPRFMTNSETYIDGSWLYMTVAVDVPTGRITIYSSGVQKAEEANAYRIYNLFRFNASSLRLFQSVNKTNDNVMISYADDVTLSNQIFLGDNFYYMTPRYEIDKGGGYFSIDELEDGLLRSSITSETFCGDQENVKIIIARYEGLVLKDISISDAQAPGLLTGTLNIENTTYNTTVKTFVWKELENAQPIAYPFIIKAAKYSRPSGAQIIADVVRMHPNNAHPRIMMDQTGFNRIQNLVNSNANAEAMYEKIKVSADNFLSAPLIIEVSNDSAGVLWKMSMELALVYKLTGDEVYLQRLWAELENIGGRESWNFSTHALTTSAIASGFAIAYDWLYDDWSQQQRDFIRSNIINKCLIYAKEQYTVGGVWWMNTDNNWAFVTNGGFAAAALAICDDVDSTDICETILEQSLLKLEQPLNSLRADGSWFEGVGYWRYGMEYFTFHMSALMSATGSHYGYMNAEGLKNTGYFPIYMTARKHIFNLNDDNETIVNSPSMFFFADFFNDRILNDNRLISLNDLNLKPSVMDLLYYNPNVNGTISASIDKIYDDEAIALLRNGFNLGSNTFCAMIHGGVNNVNHGHIDAGSFIYESYGERWVVDLGKDDYNLYNYFSTSNTPKRRWGYYRIRAEGHNTLVLNPGPLADQVLNIKSEIIGFKSMDDYGWAKVDLGDVIGAASAHRGMRLNKVNGALTLQDEITLNEGENNLYWFMHTKAQVEQGPDSSTFVLTLNGKRMLVKLLTPGMEFTLEEAVPMATSPNPDIWEENIALGKKQNANNGYRKLAIHLPDAQGSVTIAVYIARLGNNGYTPTGGIPSVEPLELWD